MSSQLIDARIRRRDLSRRDALLAKHPGMPVRFVFDVMFA